MVLDTKLNKLQHAEGPLRKMIESVKYWGPEGSAAQRHDFRTERKPPKRLLNCR
jgi:nucleolar protein 16